MSNNSIVVPDILGGAPELVEKLFAFLRRLPVQTTTVLDLALVHWIKPYGAISLLGICRYLRLLTGKPIRLTGLQDSIHAYLRRINFFKYDAETVYTTDPFDPSNELSRCSSSSNVLEISPICTYKDIYDVVTRARHILTNWLVKTGHDIDNIVNLLSEACSNILDHSGDKGIVTIQKYEYKDYTDVNLAISDLGRGIRQSLRAAHGEISDTCASYIGQALAGLSARSGKRAGQGLGAIQRIATGSGGSLYLRSEMGSVTVQSLGTIAQDDLVFFPGTQMAITFRSKCVF